jgi:hypothetical protein
MMIILFSSVLQANQKIIIKTAIKTKFGIRFFLILTLFFLFSTFSRAQTPKADFVVSGEPQASHGRILEKAQSMKQGIQDLFQFSITWPQPVQIILSRQPTATEMKWNKKALSRIIYFFPEDSLKYFELDREIIRILLYDLILTQPEKVKRKELFIPLWLVEGLIYNIRSEELVTPHFLYESHKMKQFIPLEELVSRKIFFTDTKQNVLFSFEAASLTEYLFSLPLGDVNLKKYLFLSQQEGTSGMALLKAFEKQFQTLNDLMEDWQQKSYEEGNKQ